MPSKVPCIEAIVRAAVGAGLGHRAAGQMLRKYGDMVQMRMKSKGISQSVAAAEIHAEAVQRENFRAAHAKLSAMMDLRKEDDLFEAVMQSTTNKKHVADAFVEQLDFVTKDERLTVEKQMNAIHSAIDQAQLVEVFADLKQDGHGRDFLTALHDAQSARASVPSIDPKVRKIADIVHAKMVELADFGNRQGADIRMAPGYGLKQVHDIVSLHRKFPNQIDKARDWWKAVVKKSNIDWERTLMGASTLDQDKFLDDFFTHVWNDLHPDSDDVSKAFLPGGNLAHRASAERVLWFADAESDWNYRLAMSPYAGNMNHAIEAQIRGMARNNNMMKHLGTRPDMLIKNVLERIEKDLDAGGRQDSRSEIKLIRGKVVAAASIVMSGRSDLVDNQKAADIVDFLKYWVGYLPKMGGAAVTALFTDGVGMRTQMVHEGASHLEAFMATWASFLPKTPEEKALIQSIGDQAEAFIDAQGMAWRDSKNSYGKKAMTMMMKYTGMTRITKLHRDALGLWKVYDWGKNAGTEFKDLDLARSRNLLKFGVEESEWNLVRQHPAKVGDKVALTPDSVYQIPDGEIDKLTGVASPESRKLWREKLETKLYIALRNTVDVGMNQPGLAEHILFSGYGAHKGSGIRNALDLITPLKGFAFSSWNRTADRAREAGGWQTKEAITQVSFQVAQSIVAGYVALTAKDLLSGRTRREMFDEEGNPNMSVFAAAGLRGGGLGIYGDFIFGEYDRRYQSVLGALAGPVLGQLDPAMALVTAIKEAPGEDFDKKMTRIADDSTKLLQNNVPFANVFYLKATLDHLIWWHIREALSPGVFRRSEENIEKNNYQSTWIQPTDGILPTFGTK